MIPTTPIPGAGQTDERALFEAWARTSFLMPDEELGQTDDGYYSVERLSSAWRAWQDRAELCPQITAKALDTRYSKGYAEGWGEGRAALAAAGAPVQQSKLGLDWLTIARKHGYALPDACMQAFVADLLAPDHTGDTK